jgi:hypothetical protein
MKKIIINLIVILFLIIVSLITALSTIGIETNKFNKLISDKVAQTKNIGLRLETIKFKLDLKKLSLFLETQNPEINFKNILIPAENIKVYINFVHLLKSDLKIKKTHLILKELDINQLNKLSLIIKPSNFKSLLNNKIKEGKIISEIEIFLSEKGNLENFIAKGKVRNLKLEVNNNLNFKKMNFTFFADKNDILLKNIFGNLEDLKLSDGVVKINLENGIKIDSNFNSRINLNEKFFNKYIKYLNGNNIFNSLKSLKADLNNNLSIILDNTYKVQDYNYSISGKVNSANFEFSYPIKNILLSKKIKNIYFSDFQIKTILNEKNVNFNGQGKYSFNNLDFLKINFENNFKNQLLKSKLDFDFKDDLKLDLINYKKNKGNKANIILDFEKNKNNIKINKLIFKEDDNLIKINSLDLKNNKLLSFKKIEVLTNNNEFSIKNEKKISIKGSKFDATNLVKFFKNQEGESSFGKINSDIEIDFKNIKVPVSENLQNFKLLGEIEKGQFIKISSKGDFGENNYLDIRMRKDKKTEKKYLEIYSDLTRPLLTEYSFFKGLSGGKLLFNSIIDNSQSDSNLKIENFKVVNAPGVIKLLSLADLGGLADLAEGEGLSFDVLEINMEKSKNFLKLNEIIALGPSMSVLMEGYQSKEGLTSLRGTLVPAKTLNKIISKIPLIGDIVIPKEAGEGLFGISFKMKGPKGKIKTTINPIRTLTPRFIQKIVDRNKKVK